MFTQPSPGDNLVPLTLEGVHCPVLLRERMKLDEGWFFNFDCYDSRNNFTGFDGAGAGKCL